jgi:hypothetical protein
LTTVGRVSIHGGRASKTREFEVAYASTTPSRGRGPTRGVWGAKYVRYEASARVARRRMSQKKAMGRAIFLCKLPKVSFSRPDVSFFGRKEFERLLPHTKSFKSGQLCPTDPLLPKKIAPAHKIFQIGSVIPRLTRFCHDWPSCSKAGQIGATTRQCALKKKCDFFLMPIAFSCSKTSTYSKKLRRIPQTLRWSWRIQNFFPARHRFFGQSLTKKSQTLALFWGVPPRAGSWHPLEKTRKTTG